MLSVATARRELVLSAALAGLLSLALVLVVPQGGDLAAHLYRTLLVRHAVLVWDNLWFAGQYPLLSYSLLYYLASSVVGNTALGVASMVLAAVLFASVTMREWGPAARWPARSFAVLATGQLFTGAYPFDAGVAALLATLWALQRGRIVLAAFCTALTFGFSPLAFVFLVLALVALFLRSRRISKRVIVVAAVVVAVACGELGLLAVFGTTGLVLPFRSWQLLAGLAVASSGTALALYGERERTLALLFLVWACASLVAFAVPSPVGHNVLRASTFVFPLVLLAAQLSGFRPRWLVVPTLVGALAATVGPYVSMIPVRSTDPQGTASFWRPMLAFLAVHPAEGYRVEVVPTSNHWEAYYLPRAGYALARGWYRQLDIADNPALYRSPLTPLSYRTWLLQEAVRYVLLPDGALEAGAAQREAALLRSGTSGLREVWRGAAGRIFVLPHADPLLTGPGSVAITAFTSSRIAGSVSKPGVYVLRVHYTPYWQASPRSLCVEPGQEKMTRVILTRPGRFMLRAVESPLALVAALFDHDDRQLCAVPAS
ncbi:MAG TPA: hypothetical protein VI142_00525 [Gaiellaceae bacterium]